LKQGSLTVRHTLLHLCTYVSTIDNRMLLLSSLRLPPHIYDLTVHDEDERQLTDKTSDYA